LLSKPKQKQAADMQIRRLWSSF